MRTNHNPIIFIDGVDGTGKTTLIAQLKERFEHDGYIVHQYRLPENSDRVPYRDIVKSGPREATTTEEAIFFDMEDALINMASFINVYRAMSEAVELNPNCVILCDRSLETINCYQHFFKSNPRFNYGLNQLRDELYRDMNAAVTFLLEPDDAFIRKNLKSERVGVEDDVIDRIILNKTTEMKSRYRKHSRASKIIVLTDPDRYVTDVSDYLAQLGYFSGTSVQ